MRKEIEYDDKNRFKSGKKFFIFAPPFYGRRSKKTGELLSKRAQRIEQAFVEAETWQNSVFYFWWEFLRRHEGYKLCCERGGKGKYGKLYADFGNVHEYETKDFWLWWIAKIDETNTRGETLFAEPTARALEVVHERQLAESIDTLFIKVPLEVRTSYLVRRFRKLLKDHREQVRAARTISRANYKVAAKVRNSSLYNAMQVFDECKRHPNKTKWEIAELAGIYVNRVVNGDTVDSLKLLKLDFRDVQRRVRLRQTKVVNRYLAAAEDYIEGTALGTFPARY